MRSVTLARMQRLEQKGPSYAALSRLLFTAYEGALERQCAIETKLDPIIAALASGEMDPATAASLSPEAQDAAREAGLDNNRSALLAAAKEATSLGAEHRKIVESLGTTPVGPAWLNHEVQPSSATRRFNQMNQQVQPLGSCGATTWLHQQVEPSGATNP